MNAYQPLPLLIAIWTMPLCVAQSDLPRWPAEIKAAAIAGCRESFISHAEQDYLKRNRLTELPANFRERIAPAIEPILAAECNCPVDRLEMEIAVENFLSQAPKVLARAQELQTGECAPAITKTAPQSSKEESSKGVAK
jgi:hypothetical protein